MCQIGHNILSLHSVWLEPLLGPHKLGKPFCPTSPNCPHWERTLCKEKAPKPSSTFLEADGLPFWHFTQGWNVLAQGFSFWPYLGTASAPGWHAITSRLRSINPPCLSLVSGPVLWDWWTHLGTMPNKHAFICFQSDLAFCIPRRILYSTEEAKTG